MIRPIILSILLLTSPVNADEFNRDNFGGWVDIDHDGLDSREQSLQTSVQSEEKFWLCPYTGDILLDSSKLDVDHIIPLKWAWEHGADKWSESKLKEFANDQYNLWVVSASANRSKGAKGPDEWLPPRLTFAPDYIARFLELCFMYDLQCPKLKFVKILNEVRKHVKGVKINKLD